MTILVITDGTGASQTLSVGADGSNLVSNFGRGFSFTNPTSTLTLPATTTAYTKGELVASSATAGSVVVPSFSIQNTAGGFSALRLRLSTNDTTATAWAGVAVQIDLWLAAPTFTNGDRGAFAVATGAANHLDTFTGSFGPLCGDGVYATLTPTTAIEQAIRLASGTSVFWTMQTGSTTGVTGASKVFTLTAELAN